MTELFPLTVTVLSLLVGSILGYYARQSIAKRDWKTIEAKLQKRIQKTKEEAEKILGEAKEKAKNLIETAKIQEDQKRADLLKVEQVLLKRQHIFDQKISDFEKQQRDFQEKVKRLRRIKEEIENLKGQTLENLERIAGLSKENAKEELLANLEKEYQKDILERLRKLESQGLERFERRAKEILAQAIQKCAISQTQEITTTTVSLPNEEIKGRIIGKEGRNIKTLEKLTGVEMIIDETPETVVISAFDSIRRQIAKIALEKLIQNGRIQPARIEEKVEEAKREINHQIKEAGEQAIFDLGLVGLDPKLVQLLGRLNFRTSYGQNVLLHSIEVAHLSSVLAAEIRANVSVCKKAGLLHDIGKAIDQQIEGSHVEIGIRILEKFGLEPEVILAMKSHHEEYPYENLEAVLVQVADQISGARPGARKDTLESYFKRLADLENVAVGFPGIEKAWALQAGREIRVFVRPELVDDWGAKKIAKDIAKKIQEELKYPGEIKVVVIRENRVVEHAR